MRRGRWGRGSCGSSASSRSRATSSCSRSPSSSRPGRIIGMALLWPLAYLVWTVVHGAISDWYPYGFIDAGELGAERMLRNALLILLFGVALGLAVIAVDRRRARG